MARPTNAARAERAASEADSAKHNSDFGGTAYENVQADLDRRNEIDERKPDWRPATITDQNAQEPVADNRVFAGDMGKALNQMVGRAAITENHDPMPAVTAANNPPVVPNINGTYEGKGDEVQLLRGYVPLDAELIDGQAIKRVAGEVLRLPSREAKRLVNMGAAKFTDAD